ncbi:DUF5641 domain-containing protein [Trichonephila inaurata madagascariensis]|uniref:DUF5641 domain-containing protein n=1 Tax=Trichonephila inaurata madagascariensis TaxID=2747483 RepID=A0A8X7CHI7_9ARAC|nr:DUF5641 domain-containing protein [Trichonephila inaurata madagascariensis]
MPDLKVTLWSDSTTALWWIKEYGNWSVFVANRVKEIRQPTQIQSWKKEYLSELIQTQNDKREREPRVGEMVLIGNDNKKRLTWPITKIIELIPGRDGEIRTVRLKTQRGTVIRPVQRIFPLEVQAISNSDKELKEESISVKYILNLKKS